MVLLTRSERDNVLKRFPRFELSYEERIHKKVHSSEDIFAIIPYGSKFFAWFTYFGAHKCCIIIELAPNKNIKQMHIANTCFDNDLSIGVGTIFYGTIFNNRFFVVEDVYYYMGLDYSNHNYISRIKQIAHAFNEKIKQVSFTHNSIVFSPAIMSTDYNTIIEKSQDVPYQVYGIRIVNYNLNNKHRIFIHKQDKYIHTW